MACESEVIDSVLALQHVLQERNFNLKSFSLIPLLGSPFAIAENELAVDLQFAKRAFMAVRRTLLTDRHGASDSERRHKLGQVCLLIQPAFTTIWNDRKRQLLAYCIAQASSDAMEEDIATRCECELTFSSFVLRNTHATKCADIYAHRRLVLERCVPLTRRAQFALREFSQLDELARSTARNYVLYAYRTWLFDFSLDQRTRELDAVPISRSLPCDAAYEDALVQHFCTERARLENLFDGLLVGEGKVDYSMLHYFACLVYLEFSLRFNRQSGRFCAKCQPEAETERKTGVNQSSPTWLDSLLATEQTRARQLVQNGSLLLRDGQQRHVYASELAVASLTSYLRLTELLRLEFLESDTFRFSLRHSTVTCANCGLRVDDATQK